MRYVIFVDQSGVGYEICDYDYEICDVSYD